MARHYVVTDLGTLPGGASSRATDINDKGQVVGYSQAAGREYSRFLDRKAGMKDLGVLPDGIASGASAISIRRMVAGQ